jgi:hypothetical protein
MTLDTESADIVQVLLADRRWHDVARGSAFLHFRTPDGRRVVAPVRSLLAVRTREMDLVALACEMVRSWPRSEGA